MQILPAKRKELSSNFTECSQAKRRMSIREIEDEDMSSPIASPSVTLDDISVSSMEVDQNTEQEYIVFCIDLDEEISSVFKQTCPRLDHLKKALSLFVRAKLKSDPTTKFALSTLRVSSIWLMDFTNNFSDIKNKFDKLQPGGRFNAFDMTTLFDMLEEKYMEVSILMNSNNNNNSSSSNNMNNISINSNSSGSSSSSSSGGDIKRPWSFRTIFVYSRSSTVPCYLGGEISLDNLKRFKNFYFEPVYMYHNYQVDHQKIVESIEKANKSISKVSDLSSIRKFYYCILGLLYVPPSQRPPSPKYQRFPVGLINENIFRLGTWMGQKGIPLKAYPFNPFNIQNMRAPNIQQFLQQFNPIPPLPQQIPQPPQQQNNNINTNTQLQQQQPVQPVQPPQPQANQQNNEQQQPPLANEQQVQAQQPPPPPPQEDPIELDVIVPDNQEQQNQNQNQNNNNAEIEQPQQPPPPQPTAVNNEQNNNNNSNLNNVQNNTNNNNNQNGDPFTNIQPFVFYPQFVQLLPNVLLQQQQQQPQQPQQPPNNNVINNPTNNPTNNPNNMFVDPNGLPIQYSYLSVSTINQLANLQQHIGGLLANGHPIPNALQQQWMTLTQYVQTQQILHNQFELMNHINNQQQVQNGGSAGGINNNNNLNQQNRNRNNLLNQNNLSNSSNSINNADQNSNGSMTASYISNIGTDMKQYLNNEQFSDVVFLVTKSSSISESGNERPERIYAHRVILCARSRYFRALFTNGMRESSNVKGTIREINVPNVSPDVFSALLCYLYTDDIPNHISGSTNSIGGNGNSSQQSEIDQSSPNAWLTELLILANQYMLDGLKVKCCELIGASLNHNNLVNVMALANLHEAGELKKACISYFYNNLPFILRDCSFEPSDNLDDTESLGFLIVDYFSKVAKLSLPLKNSSIINNNTTTTTTTTTTTNNNNNTTTPPNENEPSNDPSTAPKDFDELVSLF